MWQLVKHDPFANQTVQMRGIHIGEPQGVDRVIPLLVGDDENDVRAVGHRRIPVGAAYLAAVEGASQDRKTAAGRFI